VRVRARSLTLVIIAASLAAARVVAQGVDTTASLLARSAQYTTGRADGLDVLQLRPNFYVIAGGGANIGVLVGADGLVVVDSGSAARADAVVAAIRSLSRQPIRYVIDTSADADHAGGNEIVAKAGQTILNLNNAVLSGLANHRTSGAVSDRGLANRDVPRTAKLHVSER
jgi:glyoxylase-like metal-dependent hydrolase (beta-lactamase superfamily II)